jgi:Mg/Co/Ni transporter MgtE
MRNSRLAGLLAVMEPDPAVGLLEALPEPRIGKVLAMLPAPHAAPILANLSAARIDAELDSVSDGRAVALLASMPPTAAAKAMWRLDDRNEKRAREIRLALPPERQHLLSETLRRVAAESKTWPPL